MIRQYWKNIRLEFQGYNGQRFLKDLMAGLTVAAVALPLSLAFGVSNGADAAAGLITAILSGFVISMLSGASYQISGPTGTMTAVMALVVAKHGLQGIFIATFLAGAILFLCGIFRFGKLVGYIPLSVVAGFTSGIAIIIALGQVDNFFGTRSVGDNAIAKLMSYGELGFSPNWQAILTGGFVILIMLLWPKKWNARLPASLVGIVAAGLLSNLLSFDVAKVGEIPRTLLADNRLSFSHLNWDMVKSLLPPAFTIAALSMIESLLSGASGSRMKKETFYPDHQLIGQGVGNMLIPFFGGIPSAAAIARTSVAIKSGGQTRLTGIIHAAGLLACMFLLGGVMAQLPLSALAGVLFVTAFRMNEWTSIRYIFRKRLKGAIAKYLITMIATVVFDLTVAILLGVAFSILMFVVKSSNISVNLSPVDNNQFYDNTDVETANPDTIVAYISGPLFFGTVESFVHQMQDALAAKRILFSMRGVSTMDNGGAQILVEFCALCKERGIAVAFCGMQENLQHHLKRAGIEDFPVAFYFSVDRALLPQKDFTVDQN